MYYVHCTLYTVRNNTIHHLFFVLFVFIWRSKKHWVEYTVQNAVTWDEIIIIIVLIPAHTNAIYLTPTKVLAIRYLNEQSEHKRQTFIEYFKNTEIISSPQRRRRWIYDWCQSWKPSIVECSTTCLTFPKFVWRWR